MSERGQSPTWEDDALHPGVRLQELGGGHAPLEVLLHAQVQGLQAAVAQEAVKGGGHCSQGYTGRGGVEDGGMPQV